MPAEEQENTSLVKRLERRLAGSTAADTILNVLKAGLATAPFCGGIASLVTDYIPSSRLIRLEEFAARVAKDLERLQAEVRGEYLHTDDFAFMFEKCFRGASENWQQEKLDAFRGILVNSAVKENVPAEEKEYFANLVNNLSVVHIRILKFMSNPLEHLRLAGIPENQIRGGFSDFFPVAVPGITLEIIRSAFEDLYRYGLTTTDATIFSTATSAQGLKLLGNRVSKLGKEFIGFCKSP